jgi:hypothetical protein
MPPKKSATPRKTEPRTGPHRPLFVTEEDVITRLLASAMGLPRICVFKMCRRRKRCFGPDMACMLHHRGLVRKRVRAAVALISTPGTHPRRAPRRSAPPRVTCAPSGASSRATASCADKS